MNNALEDLFSGDENIDLDKRYKRDDAISGPGERGSKIDAFAMLSQELISPKYQIRTVSQQAEWTKKKSSNQKQLAKYLLRMDSVVRNLIDVCGGTEKHLFGRLIDNGEGFRIIYDEEIHKEISSMLKDYLAGIGNKSIEEISDLLVDELNLSYCHFVKKMAEAKLAEFKVIKTHEKDGDDLIIGATAVMFPTLGDKIGEYSHDQGLSWKSIKSTMRSIRVLYISIKQFRERLVSTNLRSCLSNAMAFYHATGSSKNSGFDHLDLISEATMGLMHASDMYCYGVGAKFTTYADYWIKLRVTRYIKNNNPVRVPIHVTEIVNKILGMIRFFKKENNELPNKEQVEDKIGKTFNRSIWELALNREKGVSQFVSCVTNYGEDDEFSFDIFSETEHKEETNEVSKDANMILDVAKKLVTDDKSEKFRITKDQYDSLLMKFVDDLPNSEIAKSIGGCADAKYVRIITNDALENIKAKLRIK